MESKLTPQSKSPNQNPIYNETQHLNERGGDNANLMGHLEVPCLRIDLHLLLSSRLVRLLLVLHSRCMCTRLCIVIRSIFHHLSLLTTALSGWCSFVALPTMRFNATADESNKLNACARAIERREEADIGMGDTAVCDTAVQTESYRLMVANYFSFVSRVSQWRWYTYID